MKAKWLTVILVLVPPCSHATQHFTEQQVLSYAKALDVAKLDPKLSSQRLDQWLLSGPANLETVTWEISDCDLKGNFSDPNYVAPLCVKVRFKRGNCGGWAIIRVGTFREGIGRTPHLQYIFATAGSKYDNPPESNALSDLPKLLEKASTSESRTTH